MITNFVRTSDLRKREPELARLIEYDEELEALIDKAFSDFCCDFKFKYGRSPVIDETESPYKMLIEFLSLSYVFEGLIKTNDVYILKADRYRMLYSERFEKLDPDPNGLYASVETIGMLR